MRAFEAGGGLPGSELPPITADPCQILYVTIELFPIFAVTGRRPKNKTRFVPDHVLIPTCRVLDLSCRVNWRPPIIKKHFCLKGIRTTELRSASMSMS